MALEWLSSVFSSSAGKRPEDMSFEEARPAFFKAIKREDLETLTAFATKFPDAVGWENSAGSSLFIALYHSKLASFKHLTDLGADLHGNSGELLENAARSGKKEFVQYMLEQGVCNLGTSEWSARYHGKHVIADMIKRKDIIRAEYLSKNPAPAPVAVAIVAATGDMSTDTKIEVLSPVQLRKSPDAATP